MDALQFILTSGAQLPWGQLLDGTPRLLERGKDYPVEDKTMIKLAQGAARKAGKGLRAQSTERGVVLQGF